MERRIFETELRAKTTKSGKPIIEGYGAVFDSLSQDLGGFREIVRQNSFNKTLKEGDPRSLWNHAAIYVLGRRSSGTLKIWTDSKGLGYKVEPPDTQWARDFMVSIKRGDVRESSFSFDTIKDKWGHEKGSGTLRELLELRLHEVSPVTFPAYKETQVELRTQTMLRRKLYRHLEERGMNLAVWLNNKIDKVAADEDVERSEILERISIASDRAVDTIRNILTANIDCPPVEVLMGFGEVLDAPISELISIAESDDCEFEDDERSMPGKGAHKDCNCGERSVWQVSLEMKRKELQLLELS